MLKYMIAVIWCFVSFGLGLASGIYSLKRTHYGTSITGSSFLIAAGALSIITLFFGYSILVFIGLPLLILSTLGTIFIAISQNEFT